MRRLALIFFLSGGCRFYVPPASPDYDDQCRPSDDFYVQLGHETADVEALGDIPWDPAAALQHCRERIENRGWTLVEKGGDPQTQWGRFAMTSGNTAPVVLLGADWKDRTITEQAEILCHEAVHTYQWERLGDSRFIPIYALNEGTVALEGPAYHVSLQIWKHQHPDEDPAPQAERYVDILVDQYKIIHMPRTCAKQQALDIILGETP